jgi:hypothetical protein
MEGDKRMMSKMDYRMYGEAVEKETIKHPVGKRPSGIGWTLKSAGEQTGKDHSVWERKVKRIAKNEEVELDESITKMSHSRLKFHLNTNTPHGSYSNDEMKSERDRRLKAGEGEAYRKAKAGLSEASPAKKAITRALQGMKVQSKDTVSVKKAPWEKNEAVNEVTQSAVKKTVTFTGSDGKSHTRNVPVKRIDRDEHGQEKIRESVELDEAFKVGMLKLNDGGSVILKKEDVDVLNGLFKSLSSTNRKKMESTAMKDKNGFNEILSFAREAI